MYFVIKLAFFLLSWKDLKTSSRKTVTYGSLRRSNSYPNAMSVSTGVFTAPLSGTYEFNYQMMNVSKCTFSWDEDNFSKFFFCRSTNAYYSYHKL